MIMLKYKGLTKQPTTSLAFRKQCKNIIKTQNKKTRRYLGAKGELYFRDTENVFDNVGKSDQRYILKFSLQVFEEILFA